MWTNGVHVCFMFLKHRNGGGNQVGGRPAGRGGRGGVLFDAFPVWREMR
jgi:hypothetical protein